MNLIGPSKIGFVLSKYHRRRCSKPVLDEPAKFQYPLQPTVGNLLKNKLKNVDEKNRKPRQLNLISRQIEAKFVGLATNIVETTFFTNLTDEHSRGGVFYKLNRLSPWRPTNLINRLTKLGSEEVVGHQAKLASSPSSSINHACIVNTTLASFHSAISHACACARETENGACDRTRCIIIHA